jgi:hypothetical protein
MRLVFVAILFLKGERRAEYEGTRCRFVHVSIYFWRLIVLRAISIKPSLASLAGKSEMAAMARSE